MTHREQVNEIMKYAKTRINKASKYGEDMETSRLQCLEDALEHLRNAVSIQTLIRNK